MKRIGIKIIGILVIGIIVLQANLYTVQAVTQAEINKQKNEQTKANNEIKQTEKELDSVQGEKKEVQEQVKDLSDKIADYESQIDTLDTQIAGLNTKIEESQNKLDKAQEDYTKQEELLNARLVATYEAGETSYLDFILSSSSITDLISNYFLITEVATTDTELLEKIQKQKEEIEQAKKDLEASKQELNTSKASKQSVSTQLQTAKKEKDKQVAKLSEDEKELQQHIEELRVASAKIEKELTAAQEKYKQEIEALNNANKGNGNSSGNNNGNSSGSSGGNHTGGSGKLQRPVNSGSISAGMYYPSGGYHGAIDYAVPSGTPVYAAADGVVLKTENLVTSYGTHVVIQHAGGLQSWYAHGTSGSICVSPGQTVSRGQQIMKSGNSGNSKGPHLHFEVRVSPYAYGNRVNPSQYF